MSADSKSRSPDQASARANLLAGLRNGRGSPAILPDQQHQVPAVLTQSTTAARQMKANAPVFTPGVSGGVRQVTTPPTTSDEAFSGATDYMGVLEAQLAALQMSAMHSTPSIAASYGATQGQPQQRLAAAQAQQQQHHHHHHHHHQQQQQQRLQQQQQQQQQANEQAVAQFLLQRQQQQQQLAHAQHLDNLRAQAIAIQVGQQQHNSQQQRSLFSQIQQEYEHQMRVKASLEAQQDRERQQIAAHEQRQAAQVSLQASTRNRQVQKLYQQLLEEDQAGRLDSRILAGRDPFQVAFDAVHEQHKQAQLMAATEEQIRQLQYQQYALHFQQLQQQQAANQIESERMTHRSGSLSPIQQQQQPRQSAQGQRERMPSSADQAANWRSRAVSSPREELSAPLLSIGDDSTDSAHNESSPRSSRSFNSNSHSTDDTPQTSEEDIEVEPSLFSAKGSIPNLRTGRGVGSGSASPTPSLAATGTTPATGVPPRPSSSARSSLKPSSASTIGTPRPRSADKAESSTTSPSGSSINASTPVSAPAPVVLLPAYRQPKGPPSDFATGGLNFSTRMNARTRKQALSKLKEMASASSRGAAANKNGGAGAGDALTPPVDCC